MFLRPEEILIIDLHDKTVLEAEYILEKELDTLPYYIKVVEVVHGYRQGQAILKMVREEFKHPKIKRKYRTYNRGVTRLEIEIDKR